MEEELTRKGRRKSRPIKLENSTRDDEPMEEDLIRADDEDSLIIAEDKENALGDDGRCHLCSRTFGSKIQLQTHMRLHLNGRGLPCDHCGKQYANKSKLKRHSRSHTGEKPYTCSYCSKNFSRSDNLTTHVLRQHQAARVCACSKCYATYITIADLKDHRDSCHPGEAVFQCALCEEVKTETGEMLEEHLKTKHEEAFVGVAPANDDLMSVDEPVPLIVQPVGTSNNMDTDDSGASSYTKNDISSHGGSKRKTTTPKKLKYSRTMNEESEESASELDEVDSPDNGFDETNAAQVLSQIKRNIYTRKPSETRPINLQSTDEKRYLIKPTEKLEEPHRSDSPASFSSKGSVEQQWPNAVSCEVCQLLLKDTQYLQRHLQRKHHDGIDYFCPKCPERQTTLTGLIDHVRVQHLSSEEPYCSDCNEAFPSKVDLQLHIRQHRVHQCHFCPKQFTLIHKLHSHLRRHTEQKLYCCDICRKEFNRSDLLQAHVMRSHGLMVESFCCRICKKKFANEDQLIEHSRGHCRQKCKVCNESFSVLSEMRKHLIVHADQLPHGCKICGDRYQDKDGLEQHIKSHVKAQNDSNSHPGDDSSESGISGDESLSGKSLHCCGLCAATCHSVSNLILHMDTEHQSVDKRRLWDLLMETLHNEKQQKDQVPDDVVCVQPTEPDNKVLTPVNDNIRKEKPIPLLLNPMQPLIMNQSLVVGGLNTWYTMEKKMPGLIPKPSVKEKQEKLETIAMDLTSKKTFSCSQCKEKLPGPEELAAHEKTHENGILNVAKYRCDSCPAAFETQENLDAHTRNHENNAQARCYICNQDMSSQTELLKHLMLHRHTSYHCKVCGKSLSSWSKFEAHMGTHDDGAKFACCFCDIQFMEKTRLVQHLNDVHDRNDSQICGACGKIYFDHNLLASHMKEHEDDDMTPPPEVKPIVESKAGPSQRGRPKLRRMIEDRQKHRMATENDGLLFFTPTSFPSPSPQKPQEDFSVNGQDEFSKSDDMPDKQSHVCVYCDKEFSALAKLQRHIRKHTGEKPFRCLYCEMRFSRSDNLHTHMVRRHTEEAERKCQECGDKYHNHSWSQWYQHLKYPGGVPKDQEAKRRSRSPGNTLAPQLSLMTATQSTAHGWLNRSASPDERRPRFRVKRRERDRDDSSTREVPSMEELGRLLPGADNRINDSLQVHYPFVPQNSLFQMGLTLDPSTMLLQQPPPLITPRPMTELPQMVMVQPDMLVSQRLMTDKQKDQFSQNLQQTLDEVAKESGEATKESEHGVPIQQDAALMAANAIDCDISDRHGNASPQAVPAADQDKDVTEEMNDTVDEGPEKMEEMNGDQTDEDQNMTNSDEQVEGESVQMEESLQNDRDTEDTDLVVDESVEEEKIDDDEVVDEVRENGEEARDEKGGKCDDIAIECEFCPLVFDGINSLTDHMITHKNVDPGELNTAIQKVMLCHTEQGDANMNGSPPLPLSPPSADAQQAAHPRRSLHACPQCDQTFSTKQHLLVHAKSHLASEFPFPCKLCEKSFKTKAKLQRHLKTHTGETPHTCTLCGKSFARKDNLKVHLNTAHTGADATQCPKCSKCFDTPYALRQHMRWHTDKKYECSICGTSFTWKCYLVRHMKSRHPEMAEY